MTVLPPDESKKIDAKVSEKPLGAQVKRNSISEGIYVAVEEGDTFCSLARAYYNDGKTTCADIRVNNCNAKLLDVPLKPPHKVFLPGLPKIEPLQPKVAKQKVTLKIEGGPKAGMTISTVPPAAYDQGPPDLDFFVVNVQDPLRGAQQPLGKVVLQVFYADGAAGGEYKVCPRRPLPKPLPKKAPSKKPQPEPALPPGQSKVENARTLELNVGNDGKTKTFRLVTQDDDRMYRPHDTLLVKELYEGEFIEGKNSVSAATALRTEILTMKVRATYKLPSCPRGCVVATERELDPGMKVKLAIWILRTSFTGKAAKENEIPLEAFKAYTAASGLRGSVAIDRQKVQENIATVVRRIWAEAGVQFEIVKLDLVDPPSDMIAVGDWDGKWNELVPAHLAPNGKSAAAQYTLKFDVQWAWYDDTAKALKSTTQSIEVTIPKGATPKAAAEAIAAAINAKYQPSTVATASLNPKQTNAAQESCDVVLKPEKGYMWIQKLGQTPDDEQKVHVIHFDLEQKVVLSNYPESFHIGSPQFRMLTKAFPRGTADVKIIFATSKDLSVASSAQDVEGFGLGRMREFKDLGPSDEVRDTIIAGEKLVTGERRTLLAHELGHVLIDTPGHADTMDQLMFFKPPQSEALRIPSYLPAEANWEAPQQEASGTLTFRDMPRMRTNAAARVHKLGGATGGDPVERSPVGFTPLDGKVFNAVKDGLQKLFDAIYKKDPPRMVDLAYLGNYFPVRGDELEGWTRYYELWNEADPTRGDSRLYEVKMAFRAALAYGSEDIKKIICGTKTRTQMEEYLKQSDGKDAKEQRRTLAKILAKILTHAELRTGFAEVSERCATVMPSGSTIVGYTGRYLNEARKLDLDAVFVTTERFGRPGERAASGPRKQPGPDRARHYYTTVHEALHLHAYERRAFHRYTSNPPGTLPDADWRGVIDEGATELFTRIVYFRALDELEDGPTPAYFGFDPDRFLPAYEVVKNLVAQMALDVGVKLLADAYFFGNFKPFFEALAKGRYTDKVWAEICKLTYLPDAYMDPKAAAIKANDELRKVHGLETCLDTEEICAAMKGGDFKKYAQQDPAQKVLAKLFP
jgi:hypothetical protein